MRVGAALLLAGTLACNATARVAPDGSPAGLFNEVWVPFDRLYPFFALGGIDWNRSRAVYRDSVVAATSDRERARLLGAMIGALGDYHADLTTPFGVYGPPPIRYPRHFDPALVRRAHLTAPVLATPSGAIVYARTTDGFGYVYVGSFLQVNGKTWGTEIENALDGLHGVKGIVIDIRNNGGGDEVNAQQIAARFYDRTRAYRVSRVRNGLAHDAFASPSTMSLSPSGSVRFSGPVALVTNRFNGSSAEDFVLMMRALPHVVVVGDTTLGLGSNPLRVTLSNGWTLRVPQSVQSTPQGFVYQWRGLPPAVAVPWSAADTAAGHDPYIVAAIAELQRRAP